MIGRRRQRGLALELPGTLSFVELEGLENTGGESEGQVSGVILWPLCGRFDRFPSGSEAKTDSSTIKLCTVVSVERKEVIYNWTVG